MEVNDVTVTRDSLLVKGLSDLAVMLMSLKMNKRTKVKTLTLTHQDGMSMLTHIDAMLAILGKGIELKTVEENGESVVEYSIVDIVEDGNGE